MKKSISLACFLCFHIYVSHATVRTVSNHPAGGAQYSDLQSAYNASSNGDTLLIEGTDIVYFMTCAQPFNKSLTVVGIGFNPNKQIAKKTRFRNTDCWGEFRISAGSSGSEFYGIQFTTPVYTASQSVNNILFESCLFDIHVNFECGPTTNFAFRNCIFNADNTSNLYFGLCGTSATGMISNCIFDGYIEGNNSSLAAVTIEHCLFLSTGGTQIFNNVWYAQIEDNVFMNRFPTGTFNTSYLNNICRVAGTFPPSPANGNTASGNFEATDPLFVNLPVSTLYNSTQDYHLQAGSPAIGAGIDATDIGLHGGTSGFSKNGEVLINPIIRAMNILNSSVASNGTLNVQIHASKPDND